jgi:hypothetical protein
VHAGCCCCCWQVLAAAAAAGCCYWLLHSSSQQQQQKPEAKQQPAASSSQHGHGCCMAAAWACCMGMAAAWACCCFKTGMHGAWHAAASKPGCMVHGMSLQQQQLLRACMRACVAAFVIDTIYELTRRRRPGRGESNFRIEIFAKVRHGQKGELGAPRQIDPNVPTVWILFLCRCM